MHVRVANGAVGDLDQDLTPLGLRRAGFDSCRDFPPSKTAQGRTILLLFLIRGPRRSIAKAGAIRSKTRLGGESN